MRGAIAVAVLMLAACKGESPETLHEEAPTMALMKGAPEPGRALRPALLSVQVTELRPGGKQWDQGDPKGAGKPDIAVCVRADGRHHCYPGGKSISGPACRDSFECDVRVEVPSAGEFDVEVWDADFAVHDLISKGQCSLGERCHLSACTVVVSDTALAKP